MEVKCYTDGSCLEGGRFKKIGAGAWAYKVILEDNNFYINYGTQKGATCFLMEVEAIKQSLLYLKEIKNKFNDIKIIIYSDCQNVVDNLNKIINKQKIKIKEKSKHIYDELINVINTINVKVLFKWVKGHNLKSKTEESIHNNDVDRLAREHARTLAKELIPNCFKSKKNKSNTLKDKKSNSKVTEEKDNTPIMLTKVPNDIEQFVFFTKIIVPKHMRNAIPKENKKINKFNKFLENKGVERSIEVQAGIGGTYYLVDGYISYLWLREQGEYWLPIKEIK